MKKKERQRAIIFLLILLLSVRAHAAETCDEHSFEHKILIEPSCTEPGLEADVCASCGQMINSVNLDSLGHDYGDWTVITRATCLAPGVEQCVCSRCGDIQTRETELAEHAYQTEVTEPTCTKEGYTYHVCIECGSGYNDTPTPALGHRYNGGVVTKEATLTAMGRITYTCVICGDSYTETTPKLTNPFSDVKQSQYYFNSVLWAVNQGITQGVDETHFGPDLVCSRAQVVTFLWRAAGKPQPDVSANPFVDVAEGQYYYQAVLWALAQGITQGIDENHFAPDQSCTRGQVVTFLYRAKGSPGVDSVCYFSDVTALDYFYFPVSWAAERGITTGIYGDVFAPHQACTRAQIVTFLYRNEKNS